MRILLPISREGEGRRFECPGCGEFFWTRAGNVKWCVFCRDVAMSRQRREYEARRYRKRKAERIAQQRPVANGGDGGVVE